jgi:hypothetical protein
MCQHTKAESWSGDRPGEVNFICRLGIITLAGGFPQSGVIVLSWLLKWAGAADTVQARFRENRNKSNN